MEFIPVIKTLFSA